MSDCDLCIGGRDYDSGPEFYDVKEVTSRKPFRCCECRREFPAGTKYERIVGKWDGQVSTMKTCSDCEDIRSTFCCEGGAYGELWSDFYESDGYENLTTGCIAKLSTASAKQYLMDRWNKWKFSHLPADPRNMGAK